MRSMILQHRDVWFPLVLIFMVITVGTAVALHWFVPALIFLVMQIGFAISHTIVMVEERKEWKELEKGWDRG